MATKTWDLTAPADDALLDGYPGDTSRDIKRHIQIAAGAYAEQQSTPDRTIAIYACTYYVGSDVVKYPGLDIVDLGTGGAFEVSAMTADYYNKVIFSIDSGGTLIATEGTAHAVLASVTEPILPRGQFPVCMVSVQDDGTGTAGTIKVIVQSDIEQLQMINNVSKSEYAPYYGATDQGVTGNSDTIKYFVDLIGASEKSTIILRHNSGGDTTTYTLTTSETIPSNIKLKFEPGAIIDGIGTLTVKNLGIGRRKVFGNTIIVDGVSSVDALLPEWWGVVAEDSETYAASNATALARLWACCLSTGKDIKFGTGYYVSNTNFPFRSAISTSLLDGNNATIFGNGPNTVLKTISSAGADVLQVNAMKNLHFRNLKVESEITATLGAGSNGISITNGYDNLTFLDVWAGECAYIDKGTYPDGGKGFTIQANSATNELGTITARAYIKDCAHGVNVDVDLSQLGDKTHSIDIDSTVENCYIGFVYSAAEATASVASGQTSGITVNTRSVNCQKDVVLGRAHGVKVSTNVITTKSISDLRLNPDGGTWASWDSTVVALESLYAHNSQINVFGYKKDCDYKARIGGAAAGLSGLSAATRYCNINLDIGGTSVIDDVDIVSYSGNTIKDSYLYVSGVTATSIDAAAYEAENNNVVSLNAQLATTKIGFATIKLADSGLTDKGATYSANTMSYTRIGNRVLFNLFLSVTGLGTLIAGDPAYLIDLPYTSKNESGNISAVNISFISGLTLSAAGSIRGRIGSNEDFITLSKLLATSTTGDVSALIGDLGSNAVLVMSGDYKIDTYN